MLSKIRKETTILNILVLMAGMGYRFKKAGYKEHKPMIDVLGKPMIERVIDNLTPGYRNHRFTFVTLSATTDGRLLKILRRPNATIIELPYLTEGAVESALKAENMINNDDQLLLSSCDQLVDISIDDFIDACWKFDGGMLTHPNDLSHCSYALVEDGLVTKVVEKEVVSNHALIGPFFYKHGRDYIEAAKAMMSDDFRVNGEYYNAPVFNWMIKTGKKLVIHEIPASATHLIGTPEELEAYVKLRS